MSWDLSKVDFSKQRGIDDIETGFKRWLEARPDLPIYKSKKLAYPVFVVAAQGGGYFAAYHTALFLARLYDACPNSANHIFAISSVSGGGLGAAVFTELLRNQPAPAVEPARAPQSADAPVDLCYAKAPGDATMEKAVKAFFEADLLAPVIDSMLLFDIPGLFVPPLRTGFDRAIALEQALEDAWRKVPGVDRAKTGFEHEFFTRWQPEGTVPALFMNTTGVNYGIPVIFSQLNWSQTVGGGDALSALYRFVSKGAGNEELDRLMEEHDYRLPTLANVLDFRPDLEIKMSTAVVLSARFPYVTPPGRIARSRDIHAMPEPFKNTETMEFMDGGFADNSGRYTANGILRKLNEIATREKAMAAISLHLVAFTHARTVLESKGRNYAHHELITPIAAFESIRAAKRSRAAEEMEWKGIKIHEVELFDHRFEAPVSWLLSSEPKLAIELRSGGPISPGGERQAICCEYMLPSLPFLPFVRRKVRLPMDKDDLAKVGQARDRMKEYVPNQDVYLAMLALIRGGSRIETGSLKQ